jgi:hypothetical protein
MSRVCQWRDNSREHVLAVRFDRTQPLDGQRDVRQQPAQARDRMLHDPFAGRFKGLVPFKQPDAASWREYAARTGEELSEFTLRGRRMVEDDHIERPSGDVSVAQTPCGGCEHDSAIESMPLGESLGTLGCTPRVRDGSTVAGHRCGTLEDLEVLHANEERCALLSGRHVGIEEPLQRTTQARFGRGGSRRSGPTSCLASLRTFQIASELRICTIELGQQALHEACGLTRDRETVVHPLTLRQALEQTGFAQNAKVPGDAWFALSERACQI